MGLREVAYTCLVGFALVACPAARSQNETSSALAGEVLDSAGETLAGAKLVLVHTPTASSQRAFTDSSGHFLISGLPVGGPYVLTVSAPSHDPRQFTDLHLALGENPPLRITLAAATESAVFMLEKLVVTTTRDTSPAGVGSRLERADLEALPSVERSLNEYASADPRVTLLTTDFGDELTAAGQNARFNSTQIDGVRLNDMFGLTLNGLPSQGNPFSMDTVEAISVDLSPYDVSRNGFTGASINAVTRAGSNDFHGSLTYLYRNQNFRARHPVTGERDPFTDQTAGITFGGPFVRNRLFFFAAYEHSQRTEPAPAPGFEPAPGELTRIVAAAKSYGYDPGALMNPGQPQKADDKYLTRLDWHFAPQHRLSARYSLTLGDQPTFVDYTTTGRVSLDGHWYKSTQRLETWSTQLFSRWPDGFQSEVKLAHHRYASGREPRSRFPQVRINGVDGADGEDGSVFIGTDESSQVNALGVRNTQIAALGTWLFGRHRLTAGFETERSDFENTFLQNAYGSYSFASINAFAAGTPSAFTYQYMLPGRTPTITWGYAVNSVFIQDGWRPTARLSINAGLRFDQMATNQRPEYNALFEQTFGRTNNRTVNGVHTIAPRASFSWRPDLARRFHVQGGAGIFHGRAPGVWLSNGYSNDGMASLVNTSISRFSPDPDAQPKGNPATRRQRVDLLDEHFRMPTIVRGNISLEYRPPATGIVASAEVVHTETLVGLTYRNLNLRRTGTGPDGRAIYGTRTASFALSSNSQYQHAAFSDVYLLTNTEKGRATQLTLRLRRPLRGHWAAALAYTRGKSDEVSPVTSSTASTNFSTRASLDPNDAELGTSSVEIRDRILASATLRLSPVRKLDTKLTLAYEGRSGRPFSYIFGSDVNGDSADYSNDLLYVPSGRSDPRVRWTNAAQADAFFAYLDSHPRLARFAGRVVPRNSERSRFVHQFDLKFSQQIPLWHETTAEFFADIVNFANLLNPRWGRIEQVSFPHGLIVANASYDPTANQYVYRYTEARSQTLQPGPSRWQIQAGVRLKF